MGFEIKKAVREKVYVKIALMAPSGGGKTYSALRLATGMAKEIEAISKKTPKVLMANTEAKRGYYYADEFDYDIIDIQAPHNPEKYVELIDFAAKQGYDILVLDSSSHEWEGKGGCLELQQSAGGTYQAWGKVTPRHNKFIEAIADSPIHVIATMRGKDQYELTEENGKKSVKKLGVGAKQRDGFEYEFTSTFLIDQKTHLAEAQKDNTHIFENDPMTLLTENHGQKVIQWANSGSGYTPPIKREEESVSDVIVQIKKAVDLAVEKGVGKEKIAELTKSVCIIDGKATANYNKITDISMAKKLLSTIETINMEGNN